MERDGAGSKQTSHRIQALHQIFPVERVVRVQAVEHHAAAPCGTGGVDVPPLAQIERDVAGKVERIAAPDLFLRDLVSPLNISNIGER